MVNHLQQALKAQFMFKRDVDYVVKDGEVLIVDEFTGRLMYGRRYSEGLHQAIEAKEKQHVREENQTLATITLQNYFRMYEKLAGMTGTAVTEDAEFREIYKLPVLVIPTNRADGPRRPQRPHLPHRRGEVRRRRRGDRRAPRERPAVPRRHDLDRELRAPRRACSHKRGIPHNVLNAKFHEHGGAHHRAGGPPRRRHHRHQHGRPRHRHRARRQPRVRSSRRSCIERGVKPEEATDEQRADALARAKEICAEEHVKVVEAGGLAILGTERHESRRIDNQLRGRSGRQGDPGLSQFYLSLEDDLMRLFGGDRMDRIGRLMERTQIPDDMPIQAGLVSKAIESAQRAGRGA